MIREKVLLREVRRGGQFFMTEKGKKIYISFGGGRYYTEYAALKFLVNIKKTDGLENVWIEE